MTLDTWTGGSIEMQQQDQCNLGLGAKMTLLLLSSQRAQGPLWEMQIGDWISFSPLL